MGKLKTLLLILVLSVFFAMGQSVYAEEYNDTEESGTQTYYIAKPDWYPADPKNFTFFHDEAAPRVVDQADIFTDEEEKQMEARILGIRKEFSKDLVIYTDVSDYGLGKDVWAADFYDFNGYGYGPEREGYCLFICMEQGNRGFWTCATGPESRGDYTYSASQALDDVLQEYMVSGKYAEGVLDWIGNMAGMIEKGYPFAPDWFPAKGEELLRGDEGAAPKVVDEMGFLDEQTKSDLTAKLHEISEQYGIDVAVYMGPRVSSIPSYEYNDAIYKVFGFGVGEDRSGVLLSLLYFSDTNINGYYCYFIPYGSAASRFSSNCISEIERQMYAIDAPDAGFDRFVKNLKFALKWKRAPYSLSVWAGWLRISCIIGAIVGFIMFLVASGGMKTVRRKQDADLYFEDGSLRVIPMGDHYIGSHTSRTYSPRESRSSSGGGGSYSSSYSGSSGASHSGSGRSF